MKSRTTIVLLLVTAAVAVYIFFFDQKIPSTRDRSENIRELAEFDEAKVTGMDITNADATIQLRKEGGEWKMISPVKDRANASSIPPILQAANLLDKSGIVDDLGKGDDLQEALKKYGVQKAKVRLKLLGEGMPEVIHLGKDTAFEGKIYARLHSEDVVSVIAADLRNLLVKDVADFRDRRLTHFESSKVGGVTFKTPGGEIELTQTGENWSLRTPIQARAANGRVLDLISSVEKIGIQDFISGEEANLAKFGLSEPRGTITFTALDEEEKVSIEIGNPTEKDAAKIYVRVPGRPSIFVVPKKIGDALGVKPNDLRDQKLTRVVEDLIDRITLEKPGQPPLVLVRTEETWKFLEGGLPANSDEIQRLIDVLNNTETTFAADTASDLAADGFDQPVLTIRLSSFSSENTAEAVKGETALATVQFGKTVGDKLFARVVEEPFIVTVAPGILTNLGSTPASYQPKTPTPSP